VAKKGNLFPAETTTVSLLSPLSAYVCSVRVSACISVYQRVSVCISVYQRVLVYISVYQRVSACISVYQRVLACVSVYQRVCGGSHHTSTSLS